MKMPCSQKTVTVMFNDWKLQVIYMGLTTQKKHTPYRQYQSTLCLRQLKNFYCNANSICTLFCTGFFRILTFSVVLVRPISKLWHTLIFFVASKPSSWFNNSSMVLCTSESPPLPDSILEDPMESISSMKIIEGACSLIKKKQFISSN